jgi:long-chain fatty acid transport protein
MMKRLSVIFFVFLLAVTGFQSLGAQGFRNFELGTRAATLGGAFVARADDVSAVYYNPAGLAFLPGFRFKTNLTYLEMTTKADVPGYEQTYESDPVQFRGSHFLAVNINGWLAFGLGGFAANTMESAWMDAWPGKDQTISAKVNSAYFRPAVAVKVSDHLAVGAGVDFINARQTWYYQKVFTFEETYPGFIRPTLSDTNVEGKGVGFIAGVMIRLGDRFSIGGKFVSRVRLDLAGVTNYDDIEPFNSFIFRNRETASTLTLPQEITVGVMFSPVKNLALHLDLQRIGMFDAMDWMYEVDPQLYDDLEDLVGFRPDEDELGVGLELKNTNRIKFGIEYLLPNAIALRAGYTCQKGSVDEALLHPVFPDMDTRIFSIGIGYEGPLFSFYRHDKKIGGLSIDVCFQYGTSPAWNSTHPEFPSVYQANRWNVGAGVGFVF